MAEHTVPPHTQLAQDCPVDRTLRLLSGKWRLLVLFNLEAGPIRWGALRRRLHPVTPRVFTATLRSLEEDDLVARNVKNVIPPEVSYELRPRGAALAPVFAAMGAWGAQHADQDAGTASTRT